ncbi:TRAP transporter 4TM/12TM fusion protein [Caldalkalibacillus uzonensis]|uniref:TRAP transporter 4TM/12TM fusion protein n=1 Tax=Caldalkalibacillus uzonensis TaxID=353224 RepID=A0ABU0CXR1_9BACI|nr:TRAP transporter permease [Caldalkalibacillus uzonensis]MDQ0340817.1 TRAP transporter 4TM/12TM fusion protein [Caldalkalibacillus uzonensis]
MSELNNKKQTNQTDISEEELLQKYDVESRTREYAGILARIITMIAIIWSIFQLYVNTYGGLDAIKLRAWHLGFLLILTIILYPASKRSKKFRRIPTWWDFACISLTVASIGYLLITFDDFARVRGGLHVPADYWFGAIGVFLVFEASRRVIGNVLTIIAGLFLAYNFVGPYIPGPFNHGGFSVQRVIDLMFWGGQGIFGIALGVSATYIFVFVLFGMFLKNSGFTDFINDLALTLAGRSAGGPAKVAVIGSGFMGMINGSAIANVVTTGAVTIPLMKKIGYKPHFSGAVEAVASTGGLFAPPIMGAAGFIMAEFLGVPYRTVLLAAIIPALLYYVTVFMAVHFEARRIGLEGISKENIPDAIKVLKNGWHLLIPLIILITILMLGYTPFYAAVWSLIATIASSWLRKSTRMDLSTIVRSIEEGARAAISVGIACAVVGIIVGTVSLTSMGLVLGNNILKLAGESILIAVVLTMIVSIIMGMGVPATAAYVVVATISAPLLVQLGVSALAAHMFVFLYAALSNITPPVALASYAAAGIAGAPPNKVALTAVRLGITGFIMPFFFIFNPVLLFDGENLLGSLLALTTATIGVVSLAAAVQGWLLTNMNWIQRLMLITVALLMIEPSLLNDVMGITLLAIVIIWQYLSTKNTEKRREVVQMDMKEGM